ncbi:DNA primase/helicase [Collimonas arenae]|uniref:DNA primase/helicase n=1 Tax=Collimonas arenae TaxID=279058 RepID=A0A0A1F898_9BURK|nr:DNA primase family protein [Collimonas arenae]AIY39884.1 DNA primase/helicase [Collimonas arenae]
MNSSTQMVAAVIVNADQDVVLQNAAPAEDSAPVPLADTLAPVSIDAAVSPVVAQSVVIYAGTERKAVLLKCRVIRSYCGDGTVGSMSEALVSGLNRTLAPFEGGQEAAYRACSSASYFDQQRFDGDMATSSAPRNPQYSCAQARIDGSINCPAGGCLMPDGTVATAPIDLRTWDCNIKDVSPDTHARSIVASEFRGELISTKDKIYIYGQGFYFEVEQDELYEMVIRHLGPRGTMRQLAEINKRIRLTHVKRMKVIQPSANHICFNNGTLNVATRQLEAHDPAHLLLNRIEHPYLLEATCERFIAYLNRIWRSDDDREQKIRFIRQWIGYLLVADVSMQAMLILLGLGANGKSVLMDLIRHIIGEMNISSAMLDRLKQPYVRATLEGKLLNQSADLPKRGIVSDGDLKALISGDSIEVSPKHKPSYTIKPYVRLMVATNNMPESKDTTEGYIRRLIVLEFNEHFSAEERDPNLLQSLLPEIPGIIHWALEGLYELREQGRFSIPPSSQRAVKRYQEELSPVRLFADECLEEATDRSGYVPRDLFLAFRAWCGDRGLNAGNIITLGRELSSLGFQQRKSDQTWWLVQAKDAIAEEYFRPLQIVPEEPSLLAEA